MEYCINDFIKCFNDIIHESQTLCFLTRCTDLQKEQLEKMDNFADLVNNMKQQCVASKDEDNSNLILGCECSLASVQAEISMYIHLKESNPELAWDQLILSQNLANNAMRAHDSFANCINNLKRLENIEKLIFPPQVFVSTGTIIYESVCSICGNDYDDCPHLAGLPYMGSFCIRIVKRFTPDHVAYVESPADKRHRVISFGDENGVFRNRMTWAVDTTISES